jgi:hypothetical protein
MEAVNCEVRKSGCVIPPDDAPVVALIRISDYKAEECFLNPKVTWAHPCHYFGSGVEVPCEQFKEVVEMFLQKYKDHPNNHGGVILYAVNCQEVGMRWYAVFDSIIEGYCYNIAYLDVVGGCDIF